MDADIPYLLLTPGPLTTTRSVREAMLADYSTWDVDYNQRVMEIRERLVRLATDSNDYTSVLMQGSGTFSVEATIGSVIPSDGKLLVISNGAYGSRIAQIARCLKIPLQELSYSETEPPDLAQIRATLAADSDITHVAMVHCETTTGMINPAQEVGKLVHAAGKDYILDAMSSFGGIPLSMEEFHVDYLISSANKCIQGVPGFGFVIANRQKLEQTKGLARSLSLDLYDQWNEMEHKGGKWRYTSPTHVVNAFLQALDELDAEGGIAARHARYQENQSTLVTEMQKRGLQTLLPRELQSPIITSFYYPESPSFQFNQFYDELKQRRYVIYPGKISQAETFRIGNIGHVFPADIMDLTVQIEQTLNRLGVRLVNPTIQ
ncbi:MAG: 2-aminoethylphosphonate--pyruvate transaminase [Gimesia sp.]|uniref:2-aminoethylphosphonate--pyruvate transaminase n=1 Tax=Gimesia maris TaxID=122 RepID=A0A3D3QZ81_9PLAN|nr:2-aminoethylphosphonate--pyruvate transaminase [Gimesia sp.]HCO21893.1 2-aminoethylphosphonate--pyruvate transaminase [Gimesia maris]|tara:strand:- start:71779 stop:72909 length:1131 start_codon:yes stop_codon:yes gene_type:complete